MANKIGLKAINSHPDSQDHLDYETFSETGVVAIVIGGTSAELNLKTVKQLRYRFVQSFFQDKNYVDNPPENRRWK